MRKILTVLGLLLGFGALPLLMGPSGGFPSLPTFQGVSVGATSLAAFSSPTSPQIISANGNGGTPAQWFIDMTQPANSRVYALNLSGGHLNWETCPDNGSGCTLYTIQLPTAALKFSFAHWTDTASTCTISASLQSAGMGACVRNSVGNYTITFTGAYTTTPPSCYAAIDGFDASNGIDVAQVNSTTTSTVTIATATYAAFIGAPTNRDTGAFNVMCVGN